MAYCTAADLTPHLGDLKVGSTIDPQEYVDSAATEMDGRLGEIYVLPLPTGLTPRIVAILKLVNARLGAGRLIMSVGAGKTDGSLHAYGLYLVKQAEEDLYALACGTIPIPGADRVEGAGENLAGAIINYDTDSAVTYFERFVHTDADVGWTPGA